MHLKDLAVVFAFAILTALYTVPARAGVTGDVNGDGQVTAADIFYLINFLFANGPQPINSGDVNGDGQTTAGDVFYLINRLFVAPPQVPPDARIAFHRMLCEGLSTCYETLWSMNTDGTGLVELTTPNAYVQDLFPSWSPDHTQIAFQTNRDRDAAIYIMNANGSNQHRVNNGMDWSQFPSWAPDGSRIAFVGRFATAAGGIEYGVSTMNVDGTDVKQLNHEPCCTITTRVSWSPDSSMIAYEYIGGIWIMNRDGSGQKNVSRPSLLDSRNSLLDGSPAWSPDGNTIAFNSKRDQNWNSYVAVYLMNIDGTNVRQLTFLAPMTAGAPAWSPDGLRLAFDSSAAIWTINADGTQGRQITTPGSYAATNLAAWAH
jgi:Tol biopolymer transport system component